MHLAGAEASQMRIGIALLLSVLAIPAWAAEPPPGERATPYEDEAREPSDRQGDKVLKDDRREPHERSITARPFETLPEASSPETSRRTGP
jgi:hypothetical protein